jgi:hypothetical protein
MGKPRTDPKLARSVMLKAGLKPLEPYSAFHTKWKCIHIKCGKIVYPTYASIQGGQGGCRDCGFTTGSAKRKNEITKIMKVMTKTNLKPLEPYKNTQTPWKCRCLVCKKIVYIRFKDVQRSLKGCTYCLKLKVDGAELVKKMVKAKLKPLEPYKNSFTGWKCKCLRCNKTVSPSWNQIRRGQGGCKYCAGKVVSPAQAKRVFRKSKLMPLEPYKNARTPWKSKCLDCNEIVYPTYGNVYMGHGCVYCSDIGFKPNKSAILYLITHHQMNSIKVGITNTDTKISRLEQFKRHGWKVSKKYNFQKGIHASKVENEIIDWLKIDLKLPNHLSPKEMPITGGHTETFNADTISILAIQKRIEKTIKGLQE